MGRVIFDKRASENDGEPFLEKEELGWYWNNRANFHGVPPNPDAFDNVFDEFDADGDDKATPDEVTTFIQAFENAQIGEIFLRMFNVEAEMLLNFDEFAYGYNQVVQLFPVDPCQNGEEAMPWPSPEATFE